MMVSPGRRVGRALALLAVPLLLLSACGGDEGDAGAAAQDPSTDDGNNTEGDERLVVAIGNEPETLDIGQLRAGTDYYPAVNIYEQLITRDVDGNQAPGLAKAWEVSDDGTEFTFELREDARFHNGDPVTAEDVAFSFERYVDPEMANTFAYQLGGFEKAEVVDEHTVVVHLEEYDGAFLAAGGYVWIVPKDHIEEVGTEAFAKDPVGSGPFEFVSRSIGEGFELERFDDYWGDAAGYETVEFRIISDDNARVSALRAGEVDLIAQVPPQNIDRIESDDGIEVRTAIAGDNIFFHLNSRVEGPWNEPEVRRALVAAVDRETIREAVLGGLAIELHGISAINDGFEDADVEQPAYDPDQARKLLADAGYEDGFEMELWGPVNGRLPNSEQVLQAVAGYWQEIGVEVDLNIVEYSQWVDVQKAPSDAAGSVFGLWGDAATFDPQARMQGSLTCDGPYSHICDPEVESMMEDVVGTVDPEERIDAYEDVFRYVVDNSLMLFVYTAEGAYGVSTDVDWQPWTGIPYTRMVNAKPA